jgi:hypothetical protein
MKIDNFFAELKRRNVYKVAVAYIVAGWALAQGIAQVFPVFEIPNWVIRLIVVLIIIGFPIALILSWTFELTPQGIKRTETPCLEPRDGKSTLGFTSWLSPAFSRSDYFFSDATALQHGQPEMDGLLQLRDPYHKNRSLCCHSTTSVAIRTTLTFVKACRMKSSRAWPRSPILK